MGLFCSSMLPQSWKPHPHHLLHHLQLGAVLGISHAATATGACTIAPCPCSCRCAACILHEPAPRWVDRLHVAVHGVGCHPCLHRTIAVTSSQAARISPHAQLQAMQHCCRATSALISQAALIPQMHVSAAQMQSHRMAAALRQHAIAQQGSKWCCCVVCREQVMLLCCKGASAAAMLCTCSPPEHWLMHPACERDSYEREPCPRHFCHSAVVATHTWPLASWKNAARGAVLVCCSSCSRCRFAEQAYR